MSYQVLAQKYRPETFDDLLGQDVITRTLQNAISKGRVANAYIFCGPRGVGKTSIARLISKTINCNNPGKSGPCNKCDSCIEIANGSSIDVLEIDGASNRGIDEIRTLRENVKFAPAKCKYKVYIIDEVHMLTQEAFNALLKTLEEPPDHVKFIFATTEAHKILPTILSRCQKFDFKRIPPKLIYDRIMEISKKEDISIDQKAALIIARCAEGSLRDGIVILDQMISYAGNKILAKDVIELLGIIEKEQIFELSNAIIDKDIKKITETLDGLIESGKDPVFIANSLIGHYRDLMVIKTSGGATSDMVFTEEELSEIKAYIEKLNLEEILYILQNISYCLTLMKNTLNTRIPLEICLIRLSARQSALSLDKIMEKLDSFDIDETHVSPVKSDLKEELTSSVNVKNEQIIQESPEEKQEINLSNNEEINTHWRTVLGYIKNKKMSIYTSLSEGKLIEFNKNKVVVGFGQNDSFNKDVADSKNARELLEEALNSILKTIPRIEFRVLEFLGKSSDREEQKALKKIETKAKLKPVIEKAMDVFGGQVVGDIVDES